jgi:hypothetical protein
MQYHMGGGRQYQIISYLSSNRHDDYSIATRAVPWSQLQREYRGELSLDYQILLLPPQSNFIVHYATPFKRANRDYAPSLAR